MLPVRSRLLLGGECGSGIADVAEDRSDARDRGRSSKTSNASPNAQDRADTTCMRLSPRRGCGEVEPGVCHGPDSRRFKGREIGRLRPGE